MADVRLRVDGREYGGWKSVRATRGIESISGGFDLEVSDRWSGQAAEWPIREEDECVLLLDGEPMLAGYIDRRSISYDATSHSTALSGRDWTGALVDCSAVLDKWEFRNAPLLTLAKRICEPFGISVEMQAGLSDPPVSKLSIDPGETAFEVLDRACKLAGLLPVTDGAGGLVLTRSGSGRAATDLVEGQNILAASAEYDASGRFRSYRVLGQHQGSDKMHGSAAAAIKGSATDATVRRLERTLLVRADGNVTPAQARQRAEWEAIVRAGRAYTASVTVQGWQQGNGKLWPINSLVRVASPLLGIDSDMLITEATYSLDDGGTTTQLALKRPDAFEPDPTIKPKEKKAGGKKPSGQPWAELKGGV